MNNTVSLRRNEPITNTKIMSEKLEVPHNNLLRTIEDVKKHPSGESIVFPRKFYETTFTNKMKRTFKMYELNKSAFMKVIMKLGRYEKVAVLQDEFIDGFQQMEKALLNQQNNEWVLVREQGKQERLEMTDKVKDFIEYAKSQGAKRGADFYYANLTKATYKALKLIQHEKPKTRDMLDRMEVSQLMVAEHTIRKLIELEMTKNTHYKEIYVLCKLKLESLSTNMMIN